jgi:hypothetical protein
MSLAKQFLDCFEGSDIGHARFWLTGNVREDGKQEGRACTEGSWEDRQPMTEERWKDHLDGEQMYGVPPMRSDSKVRWVAVDVDIYKGLQPEQVLEEINQNALPFVTIRSKSGGYHIYCFFSEWIDARIARSEMERLAGELGWADQELFPKQNKIDPETLPIGNWINMPYHKASLPTRFAYNERGEALSAEEFIQYVSEKRISADELKNLRVETSEILPGGPPCLQTILGQGVEVGGRNITLFNVGVYCKKASPENWKSLLEDIFQKHFSMSKDFGVKDLTHVKRSLSRKEYTYQCTVDPLRRYCRRNECINCRFGINRESQFLPKLGNATKLMSEPPVWYVTLNNGERLKISSDQLQNPRLYQLACMDQLSIVPPKTKSDDWEHIVRQVVENSSVEFPPEGSTPTEQFIEYLESFLGGVDQPQAEEVDEIIQGKPFRNGDTILFRLQDLRRYLQRYRFNELKQRDFTRILHEMGVISRQVTSGGQRVRVQQLPLSSLPSSMPFTPKASEFTKEII